MTDKTYVCGYKYCLHHGEKVNASESVVVGKKHYHWDCAATKQEITDIKNTYIERIDDKADQRIVGKVINDLVFKYNKDLDYIRFCVNYRADYGMKTKSPFVLLYLRDNPFMERKWKQSKNKGR